ncbi:hypothetical protein F8178_16515, partial [Haloechinothrix sp. LS1_15]|nr:hypothetical protein [Haloechinothrix sp. LS1_15]
MDAADPRGHPAPARALGRPGHAEGTATPRPRLSIGLWPGLLPADLRVGPPIPHLRAPGLRRLRRPGTVPAPHPPPPRTREPAMSWWHRADGT